MKDKLSAGLLVRDYFIESVISSSIERHVKCWLTCSRLLHRENQAKTYVSFFFIVLGCYYFSVLAWKQLISKLRKYCMEFHNILTKTWNYLKRPGTTYNKQEATWNNLQRARHDVKQSETKKQPTMTCNKQVLTSWNHSTWKIIDCRA